MFSFQALIDVPEIRILPVRQILKSMNISVINFATHALISQCVLSFQVPTQCNDNEHEECIAAHMRCKCNEKSWTDPFQEDLEREMYP